MTRAAISQRSRTGLVVLGAGALTLLAYLLTWGASAAAQRLCAPHSTDLCNPVSATLFANLLIANALMVTFAMLYAREKRRNGAAKLPRHLEEERRDSE